MSGLDATFEAPGPGTWTLDNTHFPRPISKMLADFFPAALRRGMRDSVQRYGIPLSLEVGISGRFLYTQPQLFGLESPDSAPPTGSEIQAHVDAATAAFDRRLWRHDLERWQAAVKPASIQRHLDLLAVVPDDLSDEALVEYLRECQQHWDTMWVQHHHFNAAALVPVGEFLVQLMAWTSLPPPELLPVLQGTTPISQGLSDETIALLDAIRADEGAAALLDGDDAGESLEALAGRPGAVGPAAKRFLLVDGERMADGFDIGDQRAIEVPEILIQRLRMGLDRQHNDDAAAQAAVALRESVPGKHRDTFNALLEEARATSRLRDERGLYSDGLAAAVVRRAVLEAGRRLVGAGRLDDPQHAVEAGIDELSALLWGVAGPSATVLAERFAARSTLTWRDAPTFIGGEPLSPPPPLDQIYPPEPARVGTDFLTVLMLAMPDPAAAAPETLRGVTASRGVYEGTARLLAEPAGLERIQPGDILITSSHAEAFNAVVPLLGAIVSDTGGVLSHLSIIGREFGIPTIVNCQDAVTAIPDGARIRVDADAGEVTVLS